MATAHTAAAIAQSAITMASRRGASRGLSVDGDGWATGTRSSHQANSTGTAKSSICTQGEKRWLITCQRHVEIGPQLAMGANGHHHGRTHGQPGQHDQRQHTGRKPPTRPPPTTLETRAGDQSQHDQLHPRRSTGWRDPPECPRWRPSHGFRATKWTAIDPSPADASRPNRRINRASTAKSGTGRS